MIATRRPELAPTRARVWLAMLCAWIVLLAAVLPAAAQGEAAWAALCLSDDGSDDGGAMAGDCLLCLNGAATAPPTPPSDLSPSSLWHSEAAQHPTATATATSWLRHGDARPRGPPQG